MNAHIQYLIHQIDTMGEMRVCVIVRRGVVQLD